MNCSFTEMKITCSCIKTGVNVFSHLVALLYNTEVALLYLSTHSTVESNKGWVYNNFLMNTFVNPSD